MLPYGMGNLPVILDRVFCNFALHSHRLHIVSLCLTAAAVCQTGPAAERCSSDRAEPSELFATCCADSAQQPAT